MEGAEGGRRGGSEAAGPAGARFAREVCRGVHW